MEGLSPITTEYHFLYIKWHESVEGKVHSEHRMLRPYALIIGTNMSEAPAQKFLTSTCARCLLPPEPVAIS